MESSPSRRITTLASILDAEKVVAPPRARALLASLALAKTIPAAPTSVREWSEAIHVERDASDAERADFAGVPSNTVDSKATEARHVDALRAAAVAMLWGRESAQGPDGQPRYPRLRKLLVDQWDQTRAACEGPDKLMMLFDAALALDRGEEPRAGREAFKTLSQPTMEAAKKEVRVGTIGVPIKTINDAVNFAKGNRAAAPEKTAASVAAEGRWATPQVSSIAQPSSLPKAPLPPAPPQRSLTPMLAGVAAVIVLGTLALIFLR